MRKVLALVGILVGIAVFAAPSASANERCYTPHVGPFPSFEVCYYLPDPNPGP